MYQRIAKAAVVALTLAAASTAAATSPAAANPAADDKDRFAAFNKYEGERAYNLLSLEPVVLNERYYTSGRAERHQFVGNVLPPGAPIPDNGPPGPPKQEIKPKTYSEANSEAKSEIKQDAKAEDKAEAKKAGSSDAASAIEKATDAKADDKK